MPKIMFVSCRSVAAAASHGPSTSLPPSTGPARKGISTLLICSLKKEQRLTSQILYALYLLLCRDYSISSMEKVPFTLLVELATSMWSHSSLKLEPIVS
jgi:hypothetical protein